MPDPTDSLRWPAYPWTGPSYVLQGTCGNCERTALVYVQRGHEAPTYHNGPECPYCGCRQWVGLRAPEDAPEKDMLAGLRAAAKIPHAPIDGDEPPTDDVRSVSWAMDSANAEETGEAPLPWEEMDEEDREHIRRITASLRDAGWVRTGKPDGHAVEALARVLYRAHDERMRVAIEDEVARFDTAQHLTVEEAEAAGIEYIYWPGNDGEYLDRLDEIADTAVDAGMYWRDSRPLFAWATREERIALSAENIIEAACEGLHNEAAANIPAAAYEELQKNLDAWCEKYGEHTTTYYPDFTRAVLAPPPEPDSDREADYAWPWGDADA